MTIKIQCKCGKVLGSSDADAGLTGVCPYCGRRLHVPGSAPIQEGDGGVHGGPISAKTLKRMEIWVFSQQSRLWLLVLLAVPLFAILIMWKAADSEKWKALNDASVMGPIEAAKQVRDKKQATDPKKPPKVRFGKAGSIYDLSKKPNEFAWSYSVEAFGAAVGASVARNHDLDDTFTDHEIRWKVTFVRMGPDLTLYFEEAEPMLEQYPAVNVWASLLPSELSQASQLKKGDRVTIRGVIGHATHARTASHPRGIVRIGPKYCIIEP